MTDIQTRLSMLEHTSDMANIVSNGNKTPAQIIADNHNKMLLRTELEELLKASADEMAKQFVNEVKRLLGN